MGLVGLVASALIVGFFPATAQAETLVAEFSVPSTAPLGVDIDGLDTGKFYRAEASGAYRYGGIFSSSSFGDAACHTAVNGEPMTRFLMDVLLGDPGVLQVWVDNLPVQWVPRNPSILGCDDPLLGGNNEYTVSFMPVGGTVNFRIHDNFHGDNAGAVNIKLFELDGPPVPTQTLIPVGVVTVDSSNPSGASSLPLLGGLDYVAEASGMFQYTHILGDQADARCSRTVADPDWIVGRYGPLNGQPWLSLAVNGDGESWQPSTLNGPCDTLTHTYRAGFAPEASGPVTLRVNDTFYGDNSGVIQVVLYLVAPSG